MGLFDKLKSLISKKEKIKEEVKEEYNVSEVSDISEEILEEIEEVDEIEEELEEENVDVIDDEENEDAEEVEDDEIEDDEDYSEEDDIDDSDDEDEDEDDDWAEFVSKQQKIQEAQDIETYDKGLEKTRKEFVSKLSMLGVKYTKVDDEYFEELEEILINADVGVNTVMTFIDQLRDRVKKEKITDTEYLNEVIVDELFIIYVDNQSLSDKINDIQKDIDEEQIKMLLEDNNIEEKEGPIEVMLIHRV